MRKRTAIFIITSFITTVAWGATRDAQLTETTPYNYNYMYPYLNNQMRTNLNPGTINSQTQNPINAVVKTQKLSGTRRVVPRPHLVRSATSGTKYGTSNRDKTPITLPQGTVQRRVVARPNIARSASGASLYRSDTTQTNRGRAVRDKNTLQYQTGLQQRATEPATPRQSSVRCMADYTDCMDKYCQREDTAYNRCYCSAKLAQIDYKYQSEIDNLIKQILTIQGTNKWTDDEMDAYWMETIGKYSDGNSWTNLENALNIDWASMDSRVRGQNAFATGHEYCVQFLRGCGYMASNLRDAYKSDIGRDCATYEASLIRLKNAAESIVSSNRE